MTKSYQLFQSSVIRKYFDHFNPLVTMRCELLGAIPASGSIRRYYSSGTHLLDLSHVQDRKKLEQITRGYSDRCSYASPLFGHKKVMEMPLQVREAYGRLYTILRGHLCREKMFPLISLSCHTSVHKHSRGNEILNRILRLSHPTFLPSPIHSSALSDWMR